MNAKLGGYLVGYGLKKRNGEEKKVIFERPIHNTITKSCLNNLLTFNGTNAKPTQNQEGNYLSLFFKSTQSSDRYGVFNSCCLGDGTGETSVNDTDLKHRVSEQTTTKKTGSGWCGTTIIDSDAIIKLRVSHVHNINSNFTIKEIGWYNAILGGGILNYTLSSRVQLDNFVDVEGGDEFYSIYEITVQFQDVERFNDFGVFGSGYEVNALCTYHYGNSIYYFFPLIDQNGIPYVAGNTANFNRYIQFAIIWSDYFVKAKTIRINWNKLKPFISNETSLRDNMASSYQVHKINDYIIDSFSRTEELVLSETMLGANIYSLSVNGTLYRFGSFDENDNFTPTPITINSALKITVRQSWSTDLLTPAA